VTRGSPGDAVIAVDVGGTGMKCALVGATGTVLHTERRATGRDRGPRAVVATVLEVAAHLANLAADRGLSPCAAGVVVPGVVDEAAGVAIWSANLGFRDVPLRDLVAARLRLPAALGHDVRAGGLAEARLGAGRDYRHVLVVPIGTGIAAAHVVDGRVFAGAHGAAGEIGHVVVRPGGPRCGCGSLGCLEAIASAAAVARRYAQRMSGSSTGAAGTGAGAVGGTAEAAGTGAGGVGGAADSAERVAALAANGDPQATAVWQETVDALADGLLTGLALFDPEVVVIGGGLAEAGEALLAPLRAALRDRLTFHREPRVVRAALGDTAGCLGAALLALEKIGGSA
jgi:glucokinase